jgi:biopolymer transport protein ExbD
MAGHPDDPRDALPPDTLGAFLPAAAGLELVQSTSLTSAYAGCVPVVTLGPDMLEVNGQPATGSTLADGVAACRDLTPRTDEDDFRGEVHLLVDGTTSYRRVVDTMASLWHQNYGNFGLVVAGGAAHTDSGSTLTEANEYTRMRRVDVMLPPGSILLPDSGGSSLEVGDELERPSPPPPSEPSPPAQPTGGLLEGLTGGTGSLFGPVGLQPLQLREQPSLQIHVGLERWTVSDGLGGVKTLAAGDTTALHAHLLGLAARWLDTFDLTLSADDATPLSTIVRVMDHAREHIDALGPRPQGRTSQGEMFPYVFFSPSAPTPSASGETDDAASTPHGPRHP